MKAKDMFEKLGYKINRNNEKEISYYTQQGIGQGYRMINFHLKKKKIVPYNRVQIDMDLLKAINQQVKELNWDNE